MGQIACLETYLVAPWNRVLLQKLTGFQPVKKFPAFCGTQMFITAFTCTRHLSLSNVSVQVPRLCVWKFRNKISFYGEELLAPPQPPGWRITPCRLSATAYSIYSQLPSILEAVPPSATWGCVMLWWQVPTYHGVVLKRQCEIITTRCVIAQKIAVL